MNDGFPERLRQLRREKKLNQGELAELVGLSQTHYGRLERGSSRPSADTLKSLAEILGVSGDYLLTGSEEAGVDRVPLEDRELLKQFREVEKLPHKDKEVIKEFLDAFLFRRKVKNLAAAG